MPLNLKSESIKGNTTDLLKDWGPTLNRWALKIENRLDEAHTKATQAPEVAKRITTQAIAALPPAPTPSDIDDGLVHGDAVWEHDSAYVELRDDFQTGGVTSGTIGELGWFTSSNNASPVVEFYGIGPVGFPSAGFVALGAGTAAINTATWIDLSGPTAGGGGSDAANNFLPLFDYPGWKMTFIFGWRRRDYSSGTFDLTKSSTYVGLGFSGGSSSENTFNTRPSVFYGARFDKDPTAPAISDTTIVLEAVTNGTSSGGATRSNTQGQTFNTGITPTEGTLYRLDLIYTTSGQLTMNLNGVGTTFTISKFVCTPDTGMTITIANGVARFFGAVATPTATNGNFIFGPGSLVTLSGITGNAGWNSTFTNLEKTGTNMLFFDIGGSAPSAPAGSKATGFPTVMPFCMTGCDSEATPIGAAQRVLLIDYFSFVWNKGLAGATTPLNTKTRYW